MFTERDKASLGLAHSTLKLTYHLFGMLPTWLFLHVCIYLFAGPLNAALPLSSEESKKQKKIIIFKCDEVIKSKELNPCCPLSKKEPFQTVADRISSHLSW